MGAKEARALDPLIERYDAPGELAASDLAALVALTADVCEAPMAAVNLLTATHQHTIATRGVDRSICSLEDSMCGVVAHETGPVVVPDASVDPRFEHHPFVTGKLGRLRLYASAPLVSEEGVTVGRLCVFDERPRQLRPQQRDALVTLATSVMDMLDLRVRSRQLEDSLAELTAVRDELKRSNDDLSRFAHQISHDLRSPLTAILNGAELLSQEPAVAGDDLLRAVVEGMLQSGRRMDALIDSVLSFALEGGRLHLSDVRLAPLFDRALGDLAARENTSDVRLRLHDLPTVRADPELLYVVALNLLSNAVKYARPGVRTEVDVHAVARADRWCIRVRDNGTGVDPARVEDVFALFVRDHHVVPGHGIGLATTRRVVEAHGGRIGIEATEGPGTTVWFDLPR